MDELVSQFIATGHAAVTVNNLAPISQMLVEWRHTAEVYADLQLHAVLTRSHDGDFGPVPPPDPEA